MDPELEQNNDSLEEEFYTEDPVGQALSRLDAFDTEQEQIEVADQQEAAELVDPREKEKWDAKAIGKELSTIIPGGLQDTATSIATFPERTADAISGEMQREKKEKGSYAPEWDPFGSYSNPIVTKTWWGNLARGVVHFGSMAAAIIPTAKLTLGRTALATTGIAANSLVRAAGIGAVSDLVSKESDGHNALGMLRERYGLMDTPLTTKDTDHPLWMKFKNIVEGMGIGLIFDGATILLGKGSRKVRDVVNDRKQSIDVQTNRKAIQEVRRNEFGFRGSKNKPIADSWQASHTSETDPFIVWENQKDKKELGC